jgi:6-pyruvoyltetrahydropterin/6-carboxytetrahydropterin synthase
MKYESTKIIELGSCAFRQWKADSHCKFIHGYRLVAKLWFACNHLDERNWVVDFGGLKGLKQIFEKQFDHTLCIAADDPLLETFKQLHATGACDLRVMSKGVGIERTAEYCFDVADAHVRGITNNRCWVERVEVWEHDKNSAIVSFDTTVITQQVGSTVATTIQAPINQVKDFLEDVAEETGINVANVLKNAPPPASQGARVGNITTTGYSNLFGGTSWGQ